MSLRILHRFSRSERWQRLDVRYLPKKFEGYDCNSVRLFLMGEPGSGTLEIARSLREHYKFTPDKQMEFEEDEIDLQGYTAMARFNAVEAMVTTVKEVQKSGLEYSRPELSKDISKALEYAPNAKIEIPDLIYRSLRRLWEDSDFVSTAERVASHNQNFEEVRHYFNNIKRIRSADYIPSLSDVYLCRRRLNGLVETPLDKKIWLLEASPLRSTPQVKRLAQYFIGFTIIIYCVDASTFDVSSKEDNKPQLLKSFEFYKTLNKSCCMKGLPVLVLFTHKEEFEQKLKSGKKLTDCFPDYKGANDNVVEAENYVREYFEGVSDKHHYSSLFIPTSLRDHNDYFRHVWIAIEHSVVDLRMRLAQFSVTE